MGLITKTKTWVDAENVNYTDINANFDSLYNEVNGNLDNANIKSSAAISTSKISGTACNLSSSQTITGVKTFDAATKPKEISTSGTSVNLDLNLANEFHITATGSTLSITVSNYTVGQVFLVTITYNQASTVVSWFSTIKWEGSTEPSITDTANRTDIFGFKVDDTSPTFLGLVVGQDLY